MSNEVLGKKMNRKKQWMLATAICMLFIAASFFGAGSVIANKYEQRPLGPLPNSNPNIPSNPSPADGATGVDLNAVLSWTGGDPHPGDTATYTVYFGTFSYPPLVSSNQSDTTYNPGTMTANTRYFWHIDAWDNHHSPAGGPFWSFVTGSQPNNPPYTPSNPSPANGTTDVSLNAVLSWTGGDPDASDAVTYDVYFGTNSSPSLLVRNQTGLTYDPGKMDYSTKYYWKIAATDSHGSIKLGGIWDFTTKVNNPPNKPSTPQGTPNGNINVEYTYTSSTTDPDGDQVYYMWDWGDGTQSNWLGPYNSGIYKNTTHTWTVKGSYSIKVKAKDIYGAQSSWSDPLPITMPFSYHMTLLQLLQRFFQWFPHAFPILRHMLGY